MIFKWLVQAGYDLDQLAIASRKYDGQASARFRQLSEICKWNANRIRPCLDYVQSGVIEFPDCPIKSMALAENEIELKNGQLTGTIFDSLQGLMESRPKKGQICHIATGTSGDAVKYLKNVVNGINSMLELTFPALVGSGMNFIGYKLALQEKAEFEPFPIPYGEEPIIVFCTICGANYVNLIEKCDYCENGWNVMESWPTNR